jgi:XTP/dITP diphosphohydrolase
MKKVSQETKIEKPKELIVATRNAKKLGEIKEILRGLKLKILSLDDFPDAPYINEDGKTFMENAAKKAVKIARWAQKLSLGEDSGLCIDALLGAPGVYSSRFSGRNKDDLKNNQKVLKLLKNIPLKKRAAHYICAVALADKNGLISAVGGRCSGLIGLKMKGTYGFGYDPLFIVPRYGKTFAQLGPAVKHKISHRYRALKKIRPIVQKCFP